jgi:hypothetical protein
MKVALVSLMVFLVGLICLFKGERSRKSEMIEPRGEALPDQKTESQLIILADASFAKKFGQAQLSIHEELDLIQVAFQDYLSFVKKGYRRPIGDNRDFVEAMTGNNFYRIAPIPPRHPRINRRGELTDRLGNPYAIHPLSEETIEVRAAGKDGVLWTDDDVVNLTLAGRELKKRVNER